MLCLGGAIPFPSTSVNLNSGYRKPNRLTCASARECECLDLHRELVPYGKAWSLQKDILKEKKAFLERNQDCSDKLIVLQHHPVYTLGTGSSEKFLNFDRNDAPFEVHRTERGGEVTYHGPGQLVMYPILDLRNHRMDLHWYLRSLEEVLIRAISSAFSIKASRIEGLTGVWVEFAAGDQKLAAIGIKVSQWITYHGLALNVTTDLTPFKWIVPCGLRNHRVGSVKELLAEIEKDAPFFGDQRLIDLSYKALIREFSEVFQLEIHQKTVSMSQLPSRN